MILDQSGLYPLEQTHQGLIEFFVVNVLRFKCFVLDRCRIAADGRDIFVSYYKIIPLVKKEAWIEVFHQVM